MADLYQFEQNINKLADRIEKGGPALQRLVALEILRLVVLGTPVGNKTVWLEPGKARAGYVGGRARANWFVGLGQATNAETEDTDPSGSTTLERGKDAIQTSSAGKDIHLNNNLPYIVPLNRGHSHQAPEGWIERAVQAGMQIANSKRVLDGDLS